MLLGYVLRLAISSSFILAGISKLFSFNEAKKFPEKIGLFQGKLGRAMGGCMPFLELFLGILSILYNNYLLNIFIFGVLLFFIVLNLKFTLEKKESKCFCYGKLIDTKIGKGGLVHYLYQFIIFLISVIILKKESNINIISEFFIIFILSFLIFINGMIIRRVIEKLNI